MMSAAASTVDRDSGSPVTSRLQQPQQLPAARLVPAPEADDQRDEADHDRDAKADVAWMIDLVDERILLGQASRWPGMTQPGDADRTDYRGRGWKRRGNAWPY